MTRPPLELVLDDPRARIHRGDCLEFLESLIPESVDLIVTDPAYSGMNDHMNFGRGRIVGARNDEDCDKWFEEFSDDPDTFLQFLRLCDRALRPDRHIYVMFDSFSLLSLGHLMREVFNVKNLIVWDKVRLGMGHYFRRRHELILFACKGKRKLATRASPDVWAVPRITGADYPTQKPVGVFEHMLAESAEPGMLVCDPFVGSGSSAVAALRHECEFVGCDSAVRAVETTARRIRELLASGIDPLESAPGSVKKAR